MRRLGDSPLSEVFLVRAEDGAEYALKVLRRSVLKEPRVRERWRREARLLEELAHPNLVRCHGALEVDGRPALLLEYVEGRTLREALKEGPLGWEQAARYGVQIARALDRLHRHGAVHRDVKPHNVLLHPRRGAVLADLGLVRREEDPTLTRQGAALGSPAYMSPEQARDPSDVDAQADIYSLGATLHHAVSGEPPFLGSGVGEVIHRVLHEDPEELPAEVPEPLARVLATAMAKDPERRYARVRDLGGDLGRVLLGYAPRLHTRFGRRRRLLRAGAAAASVIVAVTAWAGLRAWNDGSRTGNAGAETSAQADAGGEADEPDGIATPAPPPAAPPEPPSVKAAFAAWVAPFEQRFERALRRGRLAEAVAEMEAVERARLPRAVPAGGAELRAAWLREARSAVRAAAERTATRAFELLDSELRYAEEELARGDFDAGAWAQGVRGLWREAGLHVEDLPLSEGDPDPEGRLRLKRAELEREAERRRMRRALDAVPLLRARTTHLLREGRFAAARDVWMEADPLALRHSEEARYDLARIDELLALQRRLEARLRQSIGAHVALLLENGTNLVGELRATASEDAEGDPGYAVDYGGQRRVPVELLMLDADFLVSWLRADDDPWLSAQIKWCQGDVAAAHARMSALDPRTLPEEWAPAFWADLWQREAAVLRARSADEPGRATESPAPTVTHQGILVEQLRLRFPDAEITLAGDVVTLTLRPPGWDGGWELDLRSELRGWELAAWELAWRIPWGQSPPARVQWLGDVVLEHDGPRGVPALTVDGVRHLGYGMAAGVGEQRLAWRDDGLWLDDLAVDARADLAAGKVLQAEASAAFRPERLSLRFRPR